MIFYTLLVLGVIQACFSFSCFDIQNTSALVCSGMGACISENVCNCTNGQLDDCSWTCNGALFSNTTACPTGEQCTSLDVCTPLEWGIDFYSISLATNSIVGVLNIVILVSLIALVSWGFLKIGLSCIFFIRNGYTIEDDYFYGITAEKKKLLKYKDKTLSLDILEQRHTHLTGKILQLINQAVSTGVFSELKGNSLKAKIGMI